VGEEDAVEDSPAGRAPCRINNSAARLRTESSETGFADMYEPA
jgi:hypothetical protein